MKKFSLPLLLYVCAFSVCMTALGLAKYRENRKELSDACSVYCEGPLLETIQMNRIFNDSKTFVDMPMKYDPDTVLYEFGKLPTNATKEELSAFLDAYFDAAGSDLEEWVPDDFQEEPSLIRRIYDPLLKEWAREINKLWLVLGRKLAKDVFENPQRHSFLPSQNPFVVAGGRFREVYYWDSFWIVQGLIACDMRKTALQTIENIIGIVTDYGFMPNGLRIYYLNRSQPPLLSEMIVAYAKSGQYSMGFIQQSVAALEREYGFWMDESRGHVVYLTDDIGGKYALNRYYVSTDQPRPESYYEDEEIGKDLPPGEKASFFSDIAAAAESGWDFSARWLRDGFNLDTAYTRQVIPVELNCILHRMEQNMQYLYRLIGDQEKATQYARQAELRKTAIHKYLWNRSIQAWSDCILSKETSHQRRSTCTFTEAQKDSISSISQFLPLWSKSYDLGIVNESSVLDSLLQSPLILQGGITTTTAQTGLQWDFPNAWAPLQQMVIEALSTLTSDPRGPSTARFLAETWLQTTYLAFVDTGFMHEKYDARFLGGVGGGGEYEPQIGFGWTNGVALMLLNEYKTASE